MSSGAGGGTGHRYDAVLRLLDHQIVGPQGELLGNVDDLQLREHDGRLCRSPRSSSGPAVSPGAFRGVSAHGPKPSGGGWPPTPTRDRPRSSSGT